MKKKNKRLLFRIVVSVLLFAAVYAVVTLFEINGYVRLAMFVLPYLIAGYDVILKALSNLRYGRVFDENFLMFIATVGAFGLGKYPETVFVMTFYQIGELFQSIAVGRSRRSISSMMEMKPERARVIRGGETVIVSPEEVAIGETLVVRAGERIPLDGNISEGSAEIDCKALTGESVPQYVEVGAKVYSGSVDLNGTIKIQVTSEYRDSTVAKILDLVENASAAKSRTDRFITRFARVYTPCVVIGALLLFLIPSLITGEFSLWLGRALIFLVISCPCALVISVPLSYFGGLGAASKKGILIKGARYLETLADVDKVVFDKTGTLTKGEFEVSEAITSDGNASGGQMFKLLLAATALEENSNHPVARAVYSYCMDQLKVKDATQVKHLKEVAGLGVYGEYRGEKVAAGNLRLMQMLNIDVPVPETTGSVIYIGSDKEFIGYFIVKDAIKESSARAVSELKKLGVSQTVMLSGDREDSAREISERLGIDGYKAELLPQNKVSALEELFKDIKKGRRLAYVGDGINDAPVLTRADVGIAMGALGSDAAIEAADVVLMDDQPIKVADAVRVAKKTKRIVIENIVFALAIKTAFMVLGAFGYANLWEAVFADVGVSVIAILNAMRALKG